ncbi:flagellar basal body-associated protein FliL [Bradyrhizobium sp. LHD-71]|uniref:flagellar basal body-associated protein FliL n=1 Tax=Bradyrhizobium sp. LHD-71 TaxID=3072141 RepID=UPI00280D5538|nr:flagellar basal body-associated protein FliL [Bradyrhizobium sp. LHD-71]MDQ8732618.1 flagellar basal body-associated protein FliL [Bradyrhizobium sp. LHD-71]
MADNEQTDDAESGAASGGRRKLIMIAAAVIVLLGGAAGGYVLLFARNGVPEKTAELPPPAKPLFVEMPDLLVNMSTQPGERTQYLKIKLVLEVKDQPLVAQIQPNIPRMVDIFQSYLREMRPADLNGSAGMFRLKEELTRRVNTTIAPHQVSAVLFKEILVQ